MKESMPKKEAINHIVSSTDYWKGDTIDNSYYLNNLGLEKAFVAAVYHVENSHGAKLSEEDIEEARKCVGLKREENLGKTNMEVTEEYITINPFDMTEIRKYNDINSALSESVMLNESDHNHPSFCLYKNTDLQIMYVGRLIRKFGTDTFYFG